MASKKRSRLPPVATGALRAVAAALEHPRVHALLARPLRIARRRLHLGADSEFPAPPPLPGWSDLESSDDEHTTALLRGPAPARELGRTGSPSVADFAAAYASGTSPVDVANALIAAVSDSERGAGPMRFFIALDESDVRAQAEASAARHRAGRPLSALDGVPVAVKDEIDLRGYTTTLGTRMPGMQRATRDCTAVARLREQGALLVGKANMHELGAGPTGWNAAWGTTRNPWDPARFPGGSSSGSAASVAAGLVPLAVGCDGGGSIRIPASFCGVVGLKPTFGRIPKLGETLPIAHSVTHIGPLGQTVRDVAMGYAAMVGPVRDEERGGLVGHDAANAGQPRASMRGWDQTDLSDLTLGVVEAWWDAAEPEVARACERTLGALQARGARVIDVSIVGLDSVRDVLLATVGAEVQHNDWFHDRVRRSMLPPDTRIGLALARHVTRTEYSAAQRTRAEIGAGMWRLLTTVDALIAPSTLMTAPPVPRDVGGRTDVPQTMRVMQTTALANVTGQPAISFPAGFDKTDLPVGFQVIGRPWEETTLLRIALAAERARERRTPKRAWKLL